MQTYRLKCIGTRLALDVEFNTKEATKIFKIENSRDRAEMYDNCLVLKKGAVLILKFKEFHKHCPIRKFCAPKSLTS